MKGLSGGAQRETPPRLLVSVRDASDAEQAVAGGADWIDLKDPARGALGALGAESAQAAVAAIQESRLPISAALGELAELSDGGREIVERFASGNRIGVVKLGLAGCRKDRSWLPRWQDVFTTCREGGVSLAAVAYADEQQAASPPLVEILDLAVAQRCEFLLIDTYDKRKGRLLDSISVTQLADILGRARSAGIQTVVAGSLCRESLEQLPLGLIDVVAVRGAACIPDRWGRVAAPQVASLKRQLSRSK